MRHTLTIIYFKDQSGRARILEFSLVGLLSAILGFFVLLLLLIASFTLSVKFYIEKDRLIKDISSISQEKESLEAKLTDLETRISNTETAVHSMGNKGATSRTNPDKPLPSQGTLPKVKEETTSDNQEKQNDLVSLHNLEVKQVNDGAELFLAFDLMKENDKGVLTQGFVFIIGDYGDFSYTFPEDIEIKEGVPVDFKKGEPFAIKWQKHIERIFPLITSANIKNISILIFSETGVLLMKKDVNPD